MNQHIALLTEMKEQIEAKQDAKTASKVNDLISKLEENTLNIGFCGHFSAGKSSMINALLGEALLPSSPIPTSANLVILRQGPPQAVITLTDGQTKTVKLEDIDQWKHYYKDGTQVKKVDIQTDQPLLEEGVQLLDTPGIDSTDHQHQAATEEALHLADLIVFVTDYNHVQSEGNFEFLKRLKEKGKRIILVVNQIDKHRDSELSMNKFQERMNEGLRSWGVEVEALLLTSLKKPEHPYNQLPALKKGLHRVKKLKYGLITDQIHKDIRTLWKEHGTFLKNETQKRYHAMLNECEALKEKWEWSDNKNALAEYKHSEAKIARWTPECEADITSILDNAILTPYQTMQYLEAFVESQQKDFKVGLLFSKKKTAEEQERRLTQLYDNLTENIQTQVEWHVKETLKQKAHAYDLYDEGFAETLASWHLTYPKEQLVQSVKHDTVGDDYTYILAKDIKGQIKQLYRRGTRTFIEEGQALLEKYHRESFDARQALIEALKRIEDIENAYEEAQQSVEHRIQNDIARVEEDLTALTTASNEDTLTLQDAQKGPHSGAVDQSDSSQNGQVAQIAPLFAEMKSEQPVSHDQPIQQVNDESLSFNMSIPETSNANSPTPEDSNTTWDQKWHVDTEVVQHMAQRLSQGSDILSQLPHMDAWVQDLRSRAQRLEDNQFTVCLFGAFSAGKSSLINALLGEAYLPVSPHPTTAAINQLLPADAHYPTGTAVIQMKSEQEIRAQVDTALERLQLSVQGDMVNKLEQITEVDPSQLRASLKPYYTFLNACHKGWSVAQDQLGSEQKTDQDTFSQIVAEETKACFVSTIRLYVDHPLLKKGMTFIDTPGADSIFARHTNVAFDYVKHADVILYVTYYNHAFSKADRQFLDQLGRVKDQFALDKMFFLINAADLAQSEEELSLVVDHVKQELLKSGIRHPRTYPVSSLDVLYGQPNEGFHSFMSSFTQFLSTDVVDVLTKSAELDLQKGAQLIDEMLEDLQSSQDKKQAKIKSVQEAGQALQEKVKARAYVSFHEDVNRELQEHIYYVKQRLFHHFSDHVNEAFHPSVFQGNQNMKKVIDGCLEELRFDISYQLKEELKALTVRMERYLKDGLKNITQEWQHHLQQHQWHMSDLNMSKSFEQPAMPDQIAQLTDKERQTCYKQFKSAKQFFEGNGKATLQAYLEERLQGVVHEFLEEALASFQAYYQDKWDELSVEMKERLSTEIQTLMSAKIQALQGHISVQELKKAKEAYRSV
ncbi:dynamin family protein [Caldalkalibacillus salinus]|uniref:dynamin family protein n=1 Tax=Caldalkalibacillus salinus TaxID=2803787 RepID=UPI001922A101|nr:dynamin family protein [Caldalkalibacillus salinus]